MKLKKLFIEHHGFLISSPEYNSSISAVLKNAIDWISRPVAGEAPLAAFQFKAAALMSASPGALGGLRGLVHLRSILGNIGVLVLPTQVAISKGFEAFCARWLVKRFQAKCQCRSHRQKPGRCCPKTKSRGIVQRPVIRNSVD